MEAVRTILSALILCVQIISSQYAEWDEYFDHDAFVTPGENFQIYWTNNHNNNTADCSVEFGLIVETNGWVAVGISMTGEMSKSDMVVGYVDADENEVTLENWYRDAPGNGNPTLFEDQSGINVIEGWKEDIDGVIKTYLRFTKNTFPATQDNRPFGVDIPIGTAQVIYAWNDGPFGYHGSNRGHEAMNLLSGDSIPLPLPDDADWVDVLQPNMSVPSDRTTYWCTLLELPTFTEIQHVVRIDPVIQAGNEGIVHHILLNVCPERYVDEEYIGQGFDCEEWANMAVNASRCRGGLSMYVWAVGGRNFYFPENVGLEMGGPDEDAIKYVMIETHFDNPTLSSGFLDSSGLRLWYTPTLRQESAAIISIADAYDQWIPPGLETTNYAYMTGDCSENGFPDTGVKIIANFYHQHVLGRAGIVRHIRNGIELAPIYINQQYDFDFQQMVPVDEEILLLPGDEIIIECTIDSTGKDDMTYGGESTSDEMCVHFFIVYPAPAVTFVTSRFNALDKEKFIDDSIGLGYLNGTTGIYDVEMEGAVEFYEAFQNLPERWMGCADSMGNDFGEFESLETPQGFEEYDMDDYMVCDANASRPTSEPEEKEEDDQFYETWYGILIFIIIAILVAAVAVYFVRKLCLKKQAENYQKMEATMGKNNDYGSTKPTETTDAGARL